MNPGNCSIKGEFLEHRGRKLFYLLFEPVATPPHGAILFLPPFAEEMNKSRRIIASQARELAAAGNRVMLLDLTGCGDASGDFKDASWQIWLEDANVAADTLAALGAGPLKLWGLRLGALLACELSRIRSDIQQLVLWQPVLNGEQQVDQFLRLRSVALVVNSAVPFDRKALWGELRAGRTLEVAGYELSPAMALEMAKARLSEARPACETVHWIEIGISADAHFPVASDSVIANWITQGSRVDKEYVQGDPFWRTTDANINAALQRSTTQAFSLR